MIWRSRLAACCSGRRMESAASPIKDRKTPKPDPARPGMVNELLDSSIRRTK